VWLPCAGGEWLSPAVMAKSSAVGRVSAGSRSRAALEIPSYGSLASDLHQDGRASVPREVFAGVVSALSLAAVPITLGLLVFAPLGEQAASVGIPAAFLTLLVGGLVTACFGQSPMPAIGPTSATALILASMVAVLVRDPTLGAGGPADVAAVVVAAAALTVALAGVLMLAFGVLGLGSVVALVPRPVLSGFMNGIAALIAWSQVPALLGLPVPSGSAGPLQWVSAFHPATLALGLASVALGLLLSSRRPNWPVSLIVLLVGTLAYHGLAVAAPQLHLGGVIGPIPARLPTPDALAPLLDAAAGAVQRHAPLILGTAAALAIIGSLESSLNLAAVDQQTLQRSDLDRDLRVTGLANVAAALFGGLPGPQLRVRAMTLLQLGGRTRLAAACGALAAGALVVAAAPLLAALPRVVLAAIMVLISLSLVDGWWLRLVRQWFAGDRTPDLAANLSVGLLVMAITVTSGFVVAVAVGLLLSMALFIRTMNRALVRQRWSGLQRRSRRIYLPTQEACLDAARTAIEIVEIEGALHFGSAERLDREFKDLPPKTRFLVMDLHRVAAIEASGVNFLVLLSIRLARRDVRLLIAGLQPGPLAAFRTFGGAGLAEAVHPDADRAIEAAEGALLSEAGLDAPSQVPLSESLLLRGLDADQFARVFAALTEHRLAAGERLFGEGDPGDAVYVVGSGSVAVVAAVHTGRDENTLSSRAAGPRDQRFLSVSAGMMFGELAVLDGGGRTGAAVAETDVVVHRLTAPVLARWRDEDPHLAAVLYQNIAVHLSQRLRATVRAWHADAA